MVRKGFFLLLIFFISSFAPAEQFLLVKTNLLGQMAEDSSNPISPITGELRFPIRAAFYYPWFPEAWNQQGLKPFTHYHPELGYYSQDNLSVIKQQITEMQYGKIQAGIASWWGQGQPTDKRIPELLKLGEQMNFYWSLYIESEGIGNPSVDAIRADLEYIHDHYAQSPAYLKIADRFVVFVYAEPGDGCEMVNRWTQANTVGAYLVLKVFPGYLNCSSQPAGWHQYAPAKATIQERQYSFTISPGFWKATELKPRLTRNVEQWEINVQAMIASQANFQLITTFNEWGEGTAIENAQEWNSPTSYGLYLDVLHYDGHLPPSLFPPANNLSPGGCLQDRATLFALPHNDNSLGNIPGCFRYNLTARDGLGKSYYRCMKACL